MALPQTAEPSTRSADGWIAENRTTIFVILAILVAVSGFQFVSSILSKQKEEKAWAAMLDSDKPGGDKDKAAVEASVKGTSAEPWYILTQASEALAKEDTEKAKSWLNKLGQLDAAELRRVGSPGSDGAALSASLLSKIQKFEDWKNKNARFFSNPNPAEKPRVHFVTDEGEFVVSLHIAESPKTCENFVKLCKEGFYNGTRLFEVFQGYSIRAGDPSTRAETPASWTNQGPGYELDAEKNSLFAFQWAVSMYRVPGQEKVSGSQFVISLQNQLGQDSPVFGTITEGRELLKGVGEAGAEFKEGKSVPKKLLTIKETRVEE